MANSRDFQINFIANMDISNINANVGKLQNALSKLKLSDTMSNNFRNLFNSLNSELTKFETKSQSSFNKASDVSALEKSGERITTIFNQIQKEMSKIDNKDLSNSFTIDTSKIQQVKDTIAELQNQIKQKVNTSGFSEVTKAVNELNTVSRSKNIQAFFDAFKAGDLTAAGTALNNLQANVNKFTEGSEKWRIYSSNITILQQAFANLSNAIKGANLDTQLRSAQKELNNIETTELNNLYNAFNELRNSVPNVINEFNRFSSSTVNTARSTNQLNSEISQLQNQVTQFFSLGNAVQLFKRAVRSAFEDVKELDKSMTETAVVTDFSVGDMWDQLPQYTEMANELGVSILGAYDAATLYYQQGLQTNEVMAVSTETLKMARIAGMEAADATNLMTAALRGFNMEVNEVNSQRINDVYSELAAITAADTEEIGTAMSKTASIAASANMEFETTAALLSQIIETTREAPETAGTAMKTIIARFSEVKNLVDQGALTGTDEEGEVIDVNKIQTALKSVGISMNEFFAGTEGLDDILLELAEKWDTLDFTTQRYIATTAAGSRQQSRFIAMMSDYGRTQELVQAAYNSTGASQEQFEKTLDSLESKLEQLGNAWTEFTTGITNSSVIKFFVDALTTVLNIINDVTGALGDFGGGITKVLIAFAGIKIGKSLFNRFFNSIGAAFFKGGQDAGIQFNNAASSNIQQNTTINNAATQAGTTAAQKFSNAFNNFKIRKNNNGLFSALFGTGNSEETSQQFHNSLSKDIIKSKNQISGDYLQAKQTILLTYEQQGIDAAIAQAKQLGVVISEDTIRFQQLGNQSIISINKITTALGMVGMALMGLNSFLESNGASQEVVGVINSIGTALLTLPIIFQTINTAAEAFGLKLTATIAKIPIVGWIAIAISAFIALAGVISSLVETDAEKLERLSEQTERAKEAADAASDSYNELQDSLSSLDEASKSLDNLVYGTQEWSKALLEVNKQVLDLITTYPQLMKDVTQGEYGQLEIGQEGIDKLNNQLLEGIQNAQQGALISSAREAQFTSTAEKNDILTEIRTNRYQVTEEVDDGSGGTTYVPKYIEDTEIFDTISNFIDENPTELANIANEEYSNALIQAAASVGLAPVKFAELAESIDTFNNTLGVTEAQVRSNLQNNIQQDLSDEAKSSQYSNQVISGLSSSYMTNIDQDITDEKYKIQDNGSSEGEITTIAKDLQAQGHNITTTDESLNTYEEVYAALSGTALSEVQNKDYTQDQLAELIAAIQIGNEYASNVENIINAIDELAQSDKEAADQAAALLSNDFSSLTKEQIENFKSLDNGEDIKQALIDYGILSENANDEEIQALLDKVGVESFDAWAEEIQKTSTGASSQFDNLAENFPESRREEVANLINDKTLGQAQDISEALDIAQSETGEKGFEFAKSIIDGIYNNPQLLESEQQSLLDMLSAGFETPEDIENYLDILQEFDPTIDEETIKELEDNFKEAYNIIESFSLTNFREELKSTLDTIDSLKDRESLQFDDEEYEALISAGADENDFMFNGQEWVYLGGSIDNLATELQNNTSALLNNTLALLERQIESGEVFEQAVKNNNIEGLDEFVAGSMTNAAEIAAMYEQIGVTKLTDSETGIEYDVADLAVDDESLLRRLYTEQAINYSNLTGNRRTYEDVESSINIAGKTGDEVRLNDGTQEEQITATLTTAEKNGLNTNEVIAYRDSLIDITEESPKVATLSEAMATEIAADNMMMNEAISELNSNWDTWEAGLKAPGTEQYSTSINSLRNNMKNMLGITDDLSEKFLTSEENMRLMARAAEGDADAINELRAEAAKDIVANAKLDLDENSLNNINNLIDDFTSEDLEIGMQLNDTQFGEGLLNALIAAGATVDDINSAFESLGWEPELDYEEMTFAEAQKQYGDTLQEVWVPSKYDEVTGQPIDWKKKTLNSNNVSEISGDQTIRVPIIRGKNGKNKPTTFQNAFNATYKGNAKKTASPKSSGGSGGGGGGGGGSSKKENTNKWENPYDEYYNLTEQINELLRQREYLERRYDRILENRTKTAKDLYDNIQNQLASLQQEEKLQKQLLAGRQKQLQNIGSETYVDDEGNRKTYSQLGVTKYARYDMNSNRIIIDWEAINKITDEEKGAQIEDYISRLEELVDMYEETEDTLDEISDQVEELKNIGRDEYLDLEQRVYDAIVAAEQEMIDNLSETAELINESNTKLINSLQEAIDEERQARENERTEEDIQEKQRRLELLRRDTSGANALEILQLEEEISDAQESYTDSLIDQKINELQEQNDEAYEQRQEQIDLLQHLLDYNTENGEFWKDAHDLITKGIKPDGSVNVNSDMYKYLANNEGWNAMSQAQKDNWADELTKTVKQAVQFLSTSRQLENIGKKSGTITFTNANGQTLKGTVNSKGQVTVTDSKGGKYVYDDVYQDYSGAYRTFESSSDASYTAPASKKPSSGAGSGKAGGYFSKIGTYAHPKAQMPAKEVKYLQQGLNAWLNSGLKVDGIYGSKTIAAVKTAQKKLGGLTVDGYWGPKTFAAFKKSPWKSYQTGGLADFTGPAWLDGTKSKPELVLNAQDTQNFIVLKDILSDILKGGETNNSENGGDNYFEIHIEVDELGNDYDVEQVADKVKRLIVDDARYRNNNAINLIR